MSHEQLNPVEAQAWRNLVVLMDRLPAALDAEMTRAGGMTHFEYRVMALLAERPGRRMQLFDLGARLSSSLSRLSHVVTKLERLRWVRRELVPGRRGTDAVLTDTGLREVESTTPVYVAAVRGLVFDGIAGRDAQDLLELTGVLLVQVSRGMSRGIESTGAVTADA